jgi:hypothetical protein
LAAIIPSVINTSVSALSRFQPQRRRCYQDNEFDLLNLRYSDGYRYSHINCLYQAVIEKIIQNCSCLPSFAKGRAKEKIGLCHGRELACALKWVNLMGNEVGPDLTKTCSTKNVEMKCYQRCEIQFETILSSSSIWPSEMFYYRTDICHVMSKIVLKICNNTFKKMAFQETYGLQPSCNEIEYVYYSVGFCRDSKYPDYDQLRDPTAKKVAQFMYKYAQENFAILKIFINYPFYTKIKNDEEMTILTFIANTGGLMGLCLGLSFVSVFEVLYFIVNVSFSRLSKWFL